MFQTEHFFIFFCLQPKNAKKNSHYFAETFAMAILLTVLRSIRLQSIHKIRYIM